MPKGFLLNWREFLDRNRADRTVTRIQRRRGTREGTGDVRLPPTTRQTARGGLRLRDGGTGRDPAGRPAKISGQRLDGALSRAVRTMSPSPPPGGMAAGGPPPLPGGPSSPRSPWAPGAARAGSAGFVTMDRVMPIDRGRMKPGPIVVLGESLAAGVEGFSLSAGLQYDCFPALVARQTGTPFSQPCFQPPGIGVPGFSPLPLLVPGYMQSTVYHPAMPTEPFSNLAVPGFTIADALRLRPAEPGDAKRANLILGAPAFQTGDDARPTQLEGGLLAQKPALAIIAARISRGDGNAAASATRDGSRRSPPSAPISAGSSAPSARREPTSWCSRSPIPSTPRSSPRRMSPRRSCGCRRPT